MNIKAILFDFDGVVVDSMDIHYQAWQYVFDQFGININKIDFFKMEGIGIHRVGKSLVQKYKIDPDLLSELIDRKRKYYNKIDKFKIYEGLHVLLDFLKSKKIQMVIVTGGSFKRVQDQVEKYLSGYFSAIVTPECVEETKPNPEPYLKGAEILNLSSADCLVVENAPMGIRSAKAAGMKVIAIKTTLAGKYLQEADYITENFYQVKLLIQKMLNKYN